MSHKLTGIFILAILFQVANFLQGQLPFDLVPVSVFRIHRLNVRLNCYSRGSESSNLSFCLAFGECQTVISNQCLYDE